MRIRLRVRTREQIETISTDLERLERVQYRLGYCVSQLPKPLSTIIQELYIRGKERKDIILELGLSESTFRRYRQKAIEDLAEMYLAAAKRRRCTGVGRLNFERGLTAEWRKMK